MRFLLVAGDGQEPVASDESHAVRWFPRAELTRVAAEASLARMAEKAAMGTFHAVDPQAD